MKMMSDIAGALMDSFCYGKTSIPYHISSTCFRVLKLKCCGLTCGLSTAC